jgi:ribosomal protein S17
MTSMRARKYNRFAGSIDAIGGVTSNHVAQKAISFALDKRNKHRLLAKLMIKTTKLLAFYNLVWLMFLYKIKI